MAQHVTDTFASGVGVKEMGQGLVWSCNQVHIVAQTHTCTHTLA